MALRTIGTKTTTSLVALPAWAASLAAADFANIASGIVDDMVFGAVLGQPQSGVKAVLATGSTHTSTTLDTLAAVSGPPLSQIQVGDLAIGIGIVPGTFIQQLVSGTSVFLSQAATATAAGVRVAFVRATAAIPGDLSIEGRLFVPNRGILKVLAGDIVAVDNTGFPYVISANSVAYAGSQWNLV